MKIYTLYFNQLKYISCFGRKIYFQLSCFIFHNICFLFVSCFESYFVPLHQLIKKIFCRYGKGKENIKG